MMAVTPEWNVSSAWRGHEGFLHWLIGERKPRCYVELGVHTGFSYFAACQSVKAHGLDTRCFGIDTWRGDDHAGHYDDDVFDRVYEYNEARYAKFSSLVVRTFDGALRLFDHGSIDILHIDGRHDYEDVKHDFITWAQKVRPGGTVLFHDTQEDQFGVKRFWNEIRGDFPSSEFTHSCGLGVLTMTGFDE